MNISRLIQAPRSRIVLVGLAILLQVSCSDKLPGEYEGFFHLPSAEREKEFRKLSLEKQIDTYIIAITHFRPPDRTYAIDIAKSGKAATHLLLKRLLEEKKEYVQEDLIYVFEWMARLHHYGKAHASYLDYDVGSDKEVLAQIERVVSLMGQPASREASQRSLAVILGKSAGG